MLASWRPAAASERTAACKMKENKFLVSVFRPLSLRPDPGRHHGTAAILATWRLAAACEQTAACASYEVEAAPATGGPNLKQTCAGRLTECVLPGAEPGCSYQVLHHDHMVLHHHMFFEKGF